jgi:deoxyribose-phosphate aldolase
MGSTNFNTGTFSEVMHETGARLRVIRLEIKPPIVLKLILETSGLDADGIVSIGEIAKAQGFEFVNTSTERNGKFATQSNIARMRDAVGPDMGVKASGGVETLKDCLEMIEAGASRIGTSIGVTIMKEEMMAVNDSVHAGDEVINRDGGD